MVKKFILLCILHFQLYNFHQQLHYRRYEGRYHPRNENLLDLIHNLTRNYLRLDKLQLLPLHFQHEFQILLALHFPLGSLSANQSWVWRVVDLLFLSFRLLDCSHPLTIRMMRIFWNWNFGNLKFLHAFGKVKYKKFWIEF